MNNIDQPFLSHLEELRAAIIKSIAALLIAFPFMFFLAPKTLNWLISVILSDIDVSLNYFSPLEVFVIHIKIACLLDFLVCFPYIARQLWLFLLPALYEHEKKVIIPIVFLSSALFLLGVFFCVYCILPLIIKFGLSFSSPTMQAMFGVERIVNMALWLSLSFGVMFQFPLITFYLIKTGVVDYDTAVKTRPYVLVGILIIAGILTPPDVVSQLLLFTPTYLLFEMGLLFAKGKRRGKPKDSSEFEDSEGCEDSKKSFQ